jgi:hypothetical protein
MEKEDRMQCLILRRGGDVAPDRQIAQKCSDFNCTHLARVTLVVEKDEATDPLQIRLAPFGCCSDAGGSLRVPDRAGAARWDHCG